MTSPSCEKTSKRNHPYTKTPLIIGLRNGQKQASGFVFCLGFCLPVVTRATKYLMSLMLDTTRKIKRAQNSTNIQHGYFFNDIKSKRKMEISELVSARKFREFNTKQKEELYETLLQLIVSIEEIPKKSLRRTLEVTLAVLQYKGDQVAALRSRLEDKEGSDGEKKQ